MSTSKLRVLVVDDSAYNRRTITSMLEALPDLEVVARATNGKEALKMAFDLAPDVITLDLEMPEMDGFAFLRLLMKKRPTPVLVISGYAHRENVFRALELGALDFLPKPTRDASVELLNIRRDLEQKIAVVRRLQVVRLVRRALASVSSDATPRVIERETTDVIEVVEPSGSMPTCVIGLVASTGGPPAVQHIVRALPGGMPAAVVVAQHMPARFTPAFAERLDRLGSVRVVQARDGQPLCAGVVYVAPGATDLEIERDAHSAAPHVRLVSPQRRRPPPITPSGDRLFDSLGRVFGERFCGIVLTGMGNDGAAGARSAHARGATIMAEDPDEAVMPGMPRSVLEAVDGARGVPLAGLPRAIAEFVARWQTIP